MIIDQNPVLYIGYLIAVYISVFGVGEVINALWYQAKCEYRLRRFLLQTTILGILETTLYYWLFLLSIMSGEFSTSTLTPIGAWLTLKTLPKIWEEKSKQGDKYVINKFQDKYGTWPGEKYNIFLIGNLLSILSSALISSLSYQYTTYTETSHKAITVLTLFTFYMIILIATNSIRNYCNENDEDVNIKRLKDKTTKS